jgi:hypothetical protein
VKKIPTNHKEIVKKNSPSCNVWPEEKTLIEKKWKISCGLV